MKKGESEFYEKLEGKGITRRDFMKFCTFLTASMGLSNTLAAGVAEALTKPKQRPPVIWLHFAECTGCSEALLRTTYPWMDEIVLEILNIAYHETMMAASGHQTEEVLKEAVKKYKGEFICVCEGAIGTKFDGAYGKVGGRTFLEIAREVCPQAKSVISIGSCASFGGVQAAKPNPGGYMGVGEALKMKTINIPGCPPNPINLVGTIVNYLLLGKMPALDSAGRPLFAYGKTIHDQCPRRGHFDMGEMAMEFGSKEVEMGWCLYALGCRGPMTYNNCPTAKFNEGCSWPVEAGHPCIGCSEPDFWDQMSPFYA